ncbi:dienelactone hydrolase family protein [Nocardia sp. SYP-A9097]|uniref:dienelactone hydrolase family protein n=1 Tax=Nocardia sp. SYP-A9097 TaxID=2663237 RepID=UPI00129ACD67|nr:dienelactone hydrolase family protein [Nocardia sp. SYP-A9097]MRH90802.1 dienelactone hydrolase family protein [Nocardia sp. SYP-A9097]
MSSMQLDAPDGPIGAYLATPDGDGPWPGVVVLHDMLGLGTAMRENSRMLADHGYLAIAPDLFARGKLRCVPGMIRDLLANKRDAVAVRDILAARALLTNDPRCTGKVAVVGFCLGGAFALLVATEGFDAAAPFYPAGRGNYDEILHGSCPIVASYGRRDPQNIGRGAKLERILTEAGVPHDVKTYPGAGHSFADEHPKQALLKVLGLDYHADAASDAWRRIFAFFDTHLSPGDQPGGPKE